MERVRTQSYTLTLELCFDRNNPVLVLEKLCHSATSLYNCCLNECLRRLHSYERDPEYHKLKKEYRKAKKARHSLKPFKERFNIIAEKHGYTTNQLEKFLNEVRKSHFPNFGSAECQALAKRAFAAVEKVRMGKASRVRFHAMRDGTSFEGKASNSKLHYSRKTGCVHYGSYVFRLKIKPDDQYAMLCLMDDVKYVRVLKRIIRSKTRWYAQLILKGIPPCNQRHKTTYGVGSAGIDPGISTMAFVSNEDARLYELAPGIAENEAEIRRVNRAMDRSRRANNPQNYNSDGTLKKGRLRWKNSKRYIRLRNRRKELYRLCKVKREISHHILAKEILAKSSFIKTESMSYKGLAKRSKKTSQNSSNGKYNSKKRYGGTIHARAPARLIAILNEKLGYKGMSVEKVNTKTVRASQYNPLDGTYQKKELRDRMIDLGNNTIVQRDLLSAYCILHTTASNDAIDPRSAYDHFGKFKQLNDLEVARLRNEKTLMLYTS